MNRSSCSSTSQQVERRQHQRSPQERMRNRCVQKRRSKACRLSSAARPQLLGRYSTSCQFLTLSAITGISTIEVRTYLVDEGTNKAKTGDGVPYLWRPPKDVMNHRQQCLGYSLQLLLQLGRLNFGLSHRNRRPWSMHQCPHLSVIVSSWT